MVGSVLSGIPYRVPTNVRVTTASHARENTSPVGFNTLPVRERVNGAVAYPSSRSYWVLLKRARVQVRPQPALPQGLDPQPGMLRV